MACSGGRQPPEETHGQGSESGTLWESGFEHAVRPSREGGAKNIDNNAIKHGAGPALILLYQHQDMFFYKINLLWNIHIL